MHVRTFGHRSTASKAPFTIDVDICDSPLTIASVEILSSSSTKLHDVWTILPLKLNTQYSRSIALKQQPLLEADFTALVARLAILFWNVPSLNQATRTVATLRSRAAVAKRSSAVISLVRTRWASSR